MSKLVDTEAKSSNERYRSWAITQNNYPDTELADNMECKYLVYGKELSKTNTPHLQITCVYKNGKSVSAVRKLWPKCNVEVAANVERSILYCMKGEMDSDLFKSIKDNKLLTEHEEYGKNADVTERGDKPKSQQEKGDCEKERWKNIIDLAKKGDMESICEADPQAYVHAYKTLKQIGTDHIEAKHSLDKLENYWVWGKAGLGKTLWVQSETKEECYMKPCTKWWDGYKGQEDVLIDELEKKAAEYNMGHYLKEWAQHKYFLAEIKGGTISIRPKRLYVTSNYSMEEIFGHDEEMLAAIKRRFKEVHFTGFKELTVEKYEQKGLDKSPFKVNDKNKKRGMVEEEDEEVPGIPLKYRKGEVGITCGSRHCILMNAHLPNCTKYVPDNMYEK